VANAQDDPWVGRIERARVLAAERPPVADILTFYAGLASCQRTLAKRTRLTARDSPFLDAIDFEKASQAVQTLLSWLREHAPVPLATMAADAASLDSARWRDLMHQFMNHDEIDVSLEFILEAALQPFAEAAAISRRSVREPTHDPGVPKSRCPMCASLPAVGTLREEGHGARRTLVCSFCFTEWPYLRVVCPACDETRFDALPIYRADGIDEARLDACDSCHIYLKTIDLTKNALAQPIVDDLATLTLDLWARERGYRRMRPNVLRL
jgi:FdhE protein